MFRINTGRLKASNYEKAPQIFFTKSTGSPWFFLIHILVWCHLGRGGHESVDQADASSSSSQGLGVAPPHSTTEPHFCQDSTFQASRVTNPPIRGFTLVMIDHLQTAPIRLVNPPPRHQLFHHKIDTKVNMLFSGI